MTEAQDRENAIADAENELSEMTDEEVAPVAAWVKKWYQKTGYKKLGRVLLEAADFIEKKKKKEG